MSLFSDFNLISFVSGLLAIMYALSIHEFAHGYVAYRLGDPTAKLMGRLTLNPLVHIDILGLIMMALFRFGWAKAVPFDPSYFKNPKRDAALTALAGPVANILSGILFAVIMGIIVALPLNMELRTNLYNVFRITMTTNVFLAVFNLLPIPPLDGSKIANVFLPQRLYWKLMSIERYGFIILVILLQIRMFRNIIGGISGFILSYLYGMTALIANLLGTILGS